MKAFPLKFLTHFVVKIFQVFIPLTLR